MTRSLNGVEARRFKVVTFNVHELGAREDQVHEIMTREKMNIFVQIEAVVAAEQTVAIDAQVEAIGNDPVSEGALE